jgi:FkbM family methyltransferase
MSHEDTFLAAVRGLTQSRLYAVPDAARRVVERDGHASTVVLLGTHGLGSYLLDVPASDRNCHVVAVVDDARCATQSQYHGIPLVSSAQFLALAHEHGGLVAVNTCRKDRPRRYFDELCAANGIACMNYEQAVRALALHGRLDYRVDDWGPEIVPNAQRYLELSRRLDDGLSVRTLFAVLSFHLTCGTSSVDDVAQSYGDLYFRSGLFEFAHSWMIEPDRQNIQTLQGILNALPQAQASRVSLHACGVGETPAQVPFQHGGGHGGAVLADGSGTDEADMIDVLPLDRIIDDAPTFIKMDVEGSELAALKGARQTIRAHKPKLAISAYHRASDLLALSDYLLALRPDYRVGLRHHTAYRWDTCLYFY